MIVIGIIQAIDVFVLLLDVKLMDVGLIFKVM
jgi:hypothetical protein